MSDEKLPRRSRVDLQTNPERVLYNAVGVIENMGADIRLTEAVTLIEKARSLVSEVVDEQLREVKF